MEQSCSCENCELKELFFKSVSTEELVSICSGKVEKAFPKGGTIIEQGEKIETFTYLKTGLVKLYVAQKNQEQILTIAKPLDFISIISIFSSKNYQYSVKALEDSVTCNIDMEQIYRFSRGDGKFALNLLEKMGKVSDKIIQESLEFRRHNLKGRLANVLLFFANQIYAQDNYELPLSRKEIGEYIGMTTENVIRALSEFRKDGIIKIFGKVIEIVEKERLERLAKFG